MTRRSDMRRVHSPPGPQGRGLKLVGFAALGLGCLLAGVVVFLIVASPVQGVRDQLIQQVKFHTGRDLVVAGPTSLIFFPRLAVTFGDVALSAPRDMGGAPTLTVRMIEAELGLISLLSRQSGVKRLVLSRPWLDLRVDSQGRRSWDLALGTARPSQVAAPRGEVWRRSADDGNLAAMLQMVSPIDVRIVDGMGRYVDERSGLRQDVTAVNMDLALNDNAGPLRANGSFVWQGEKAAVEASLSTLRALVERRAARLTAKLTRQAVQASYDGVITGELALDGNVNLRASSKRSGQPTNGGRDVGALVLSSSMTSRDGRLSLTNLEATLGATSLTGTLVIESKATRPYVSGSLEASQLDLGELLTHPSLALDNPARQGPSTPRARSAVKADWSDDLIDFVPLRYADGDLAMVADRLLYNDVKAGKVRLSLQLKDSIATLTLDEMLLYEGRGHGSLTLDGRGQTPAIAVSLLLESISAQPVLKDALGFDLLEGQSKISIGIAGQGASERQIVSTLNGKLDITATNGNIDAIDVGKILRGIEQGRFAGLQTLVGEKTPFSELAGTFTITHGVAENRDLRLVSPNLRVTGAGSFNLPARSLDYTMRAKLAPSVSAERLINLSNIEIPVLIEGSWDQPTFSLAGQDQISEAIRQIGKSANPQDVEEVLKGLLGGGDGPQRVKPRDILERFFKKQ